LSFVALLILILIGGATLSASVSASRYPRCEESSVGVVWESHRGDLLFVPEGKCP